MIFREGTFDEAFPHASSAWASSTPQSSGFQSAPCCSRSWLELRRDGGRSVKSRPRAPETPVRRSVTTVGPVVAA
jgi:hypothetical protein